MTIIAPTPIRELVDAHRAAGSTALEQPIRWKPTAWRRQDLNALQAEVEAAEGVSEELAEGWRLIRRRHVLLLATELGLGPRGLFTGAMIWGFGPIGYGATRTARMIAPYSRIDLESRLRGFAAAAAKGPEAAWDAIGAGETKIRGLGPAFGTKLTYFLALANEPPPYPLPLIADLNTSWAIWDLCDIPRSAFARSNYFRYVHLTHRWAQELQFPVDEVERALFEYGKEVRRRRRPRRSTGYS
jgi:hypothetical protein